MSDGKSIQGFKHSEFAAAAENPEKVFGTPDVRMDDLPSGVRLYLREKAIDLTGKRVAINVYRLQDDGGLKVKRVWVGKMRINRVPEDAEIAEQFGPGSYVWILKWSGQDGKESGIISDPVEVDEESGRAAHDAWKRRQVGADSTPAASPAAAPAAPSAPTVGGDAAFILKIMEAAEERTLARFERMASIFRGGQSDTPADVLQAAYKGASEMMQRAVETNLAMAKSVNRVNQAALTAPPPEDADDPEPEASNLPPWLDALMPHIEKGLGKLLEGGPMGAAVKTLILSSEEWKAIFGDPEKWGQAVAAMEQTFGSDRTKRALDILLNRREDKAGKKGRK